MNSKYRVEFDSNKKPYGLNLEHQRSILEKMTNFVKDMRIKGHKKLLSFQKSILLKNISLQQLLLYLQEKYTSDQCHPTYLCTNRLNQDCLENLFSCLRAMGAANDQPSALNLKLRLRRYLLGKNTLDVLSNAINTDLDQGETNLINFSDATDPLMSLAFDSSEAENTNFFVNEDSNSLAHRILNEFENEQFSYHDTNEFENELGMYG